MGRRTFIGAIVAFFIPTTERRVAYRWYRMSNGKLMRIYGNG